MFLFYFRIKKSLIETKSLKLWRHLNSFKKVILQVWKEGVTIYIDLCKYLCVSQ